MRAETSKSKTGKSKAGLCKSCDLAGFVGVKRRVHLPEALRLPGMGALAQVDIDIGVLVD